MWKALSLLFLAGAEVLLGAPNTTFLFLGLAQHLPCDLRWGNDLSVRGEASNSQPTNHHANMRTTFFSFFFYHNHLIKNSFFDHLIQCRKANDSRLVRDGVILPIPTLSDNEWAIRESQVTVNILLCLMKIFSVQLCWMRINGISIITIALSKPLIGLILIPV